ncbi:hypothetical protein [Streptomyces sp. BH055]|uniref:hypothetical protein n=1 Tax=unclassified Streptomyces TaxID=2593676 RepID=UPI003BB6A5DF
MTVLPLPLSAICTLASEPTLLPRIRMAIAIIAQEVFAEDPTTPGYPLRWNLAKTALTPSEAQATQMATGLVVFPSLLQAAATAGSTSGPEMAAAITDEQLLDAIRQGWSTVAGVAPDVAAG